MVYIYEYLAMRLRSSSILMVFILLGGGMQRSLRQEYGCRWGGCDDGGQLHGVAVIIWKNSYVCYDIIIYLLYSQLQKEGMSKYTLKYHDHFNIQNITSKYNQTLLSKLRIVISSSNQLLAVLTQSSTNIFNATDNQLIYNINQPYTQAIFTNNDQHIYLSNTQSLIKYTLTTQNKTTILPSKSQASITNLRLSSNTKTLYFLNNNQIYSHNLFSNKILKVKMNITNESCQVDLFQIDHMSKLLVTVSDNCYLCSYRLRDDVYQLSNTNFVDKCRSNQLTFFNNQIILTQSIALIDADLLIFDFGLKMKKKIPQPTNNTQTYLQVVRNYLISYSKGDNYLYMYWNHLSFYKEKIEYGNHSIIDVSYNYLKNLVYIALYNYQSNLYYLQSYSLEFNCSNIKHALESKTNSSTFMEGYGGQCECLGGYSFSAQSIECKVKSCLPSSGLLEECKCSALEIYDSFTAKCKIDCHQIYKATPTILQNTYLCSCLTPLEWNPSTKDCSLIDCSLISNSISKIINYTCTCQLSYLWIQSNLTCNPVTVIPVVQESKSSALLVILILIIVASIIVSLVVCFYKTFKKSPEDHPRVYEEYGKKGQGEQRETHRHFEEDEINRQKNSNNLQIESDIKSKQVSLPTSSDKISINSRQQSSKPPSQ